MTDIHVPTNLSLPLEEVAMEIEIESAMTQDIPMAAPEVEINPRKKKLIKELEKKTLLSDNRRKRIAALRSKTWRFQKQVAEQSSLIEELKTQSLINQETADLLSSIDTINRDFLKKFICKMNVERKYSPELRKFALSLHYISPRAYTFIRKQFNTCFPHPRTLSRWYQCIDGNPDFSTESVKAVKFLHEMQESLKQCLGLTLFFDVSHFNSPTFLDCHYSLLIKAISLKYLKVRIHYATKKFSEKNRCQNFFNILVLFQGQ